MDGEEDEHIYFSYKHLLYKNQINNSRMKALYLSVICSYKVYVYFYWEINQKSNKFNAFAFGNENLQELNQKYLVI